MKRNGRIFTQVLAVMTGLTSSMCHKHRPELGMRLRGLIWIGIGLAIYVGGLALDRPLTLRFTPIPLGWVIAAIGLIYLIYDVWAQKRRSREDVGAPPP